MEVDAQAAQQQAGPTTVQPSIRVLALYCDGSSDDNDPGFDPPENSNASLLISRPGVEVSFKCSSSSSKVLLHVFVHLQHARVLDLSFFKTCLRRMHML
jgi:hypothetical protein